MNVHLSKGSMIVWALLVVLMILSFLQTFQTNRKLADDQRAMQIHAECLQTVLNSTIAALNDRTSTTPELNQADQDKVRAEARMIGFLVKVQGSTPPGQNAPNNVVEEFNRRVAAYFNTIQRYLTVLGRTDINQTVNPFPDENAYQVCIGEHQ